jgi:hypothetical protein
MLGHQQDVFIVGQAYELAADQRSGREIEQGGGFGCTQLRERLLSLRRFKSAQVVFGERKAAVGRSDDLDWTVGGAREGRAQGFVAGDDACSRPSASASRSSAAVQAQRQRHVVGGAGRCGRAGR